MFFTIPKTNFNSSVTFIFLPVNAIDLEPSKMCLSGEEGNNEHSYGLVVVTKLLVTVVCE